MKPIRLLFLFVLCLLGNNTTFPHDSCNVPSVVFWEYDSLNNMTTIRCLDSIGDLKTLVPNGGSGFLSPEGDYIAYTTTNNYGTQFFEYDMSLYVYDIKTDNLRQLRDSEGHIAANWVTSNDLIISTWDDTITTYAAFKPDHRFLYNVQSAELLELEWPIGNGARVVGYWAEAESFLFADYSNGLSTITLDGVLTPISIPVNAFDSDFVMSQDSRLVAYRIWCNNESILTNCLAIYELGKDDVEVITAFAEDYQGFYHFEFSYTGRYITVLLHPNAILGIYDLQQQKIALMFSDMNISGYRWSQNQDRLFIAVLNENDETNSYIYAVDPLSGEKELVIDAPVDFLGFY
ncbi:MAG: hypothetical protein H6672_19870 [Anaerolineaceae bacterium]|nr:hypothetical protein [Anaerolineaceae bacterium]